MTINIRDLPASVRKQINSGSGKKKTVTSHIPSVSVNDRINITKISRFNETSGDMIIDMHVEIKPLPKGRPRMTINKELLMKALAAGPVRGMNMAMSALSMKTPANTREYEKTLAQCAIIGMQGKQAVDTHCSVEIMMSGASPLADIDNCMKAIMDAMNGIVYTDDRKVRKASIESVPDNGQYVHVIVRKY